MHKATREHRSRQLNPQQRTNHIGRDDNRANQMNPNNDAYRRSRGGRPQASDGAGWSSLLTAVGVVVAGVAALAVAASAASGADAQGDKDK